MLARRVSEAGHGYCWRVQVKVAGVLMVLCSSGDVFCSEGDVDCGGFCEFEEFTKRCVFAGAVDDCVASYLRV